MKMGIEKDLWPRFGKNTHISMISNSVTHPQSDTNTAIAGNSTLILQETPVSANITTPSADVAASNGECSSVS